MIGIVMGTVMILGCGIGLWFFGNWIFKQKIRPIGFWANGKPMEEKYIPDIPGYNRAYGRLMRFFSIPAICAGNLLFLSIWWDVLATVSLLVLLLWGSIGILWLILSYKKLENRYILR